MLRQACVIALLSSPSLALDCTPSTACLTDGTCDLDHSEGPFALEMRAEGLALLDPTEPAESREPWMLLAEQPAGDGGTRVFTVIDPRRGDAAMLSLSDERAFILTVHGLTFGAPYGLMTIGTCAGDPL
ncbi:hypothetical protein [Vannielia litorea]|uniref:Uncharacterized protein n=1 Tax=Vannielia litorea TaxID=1217970 RepID=A0A1N6F884_9RHOB|nr:hypothetical protein [Vannielia litorea]SIN91426.1 hypothetical protein SAMN05444002_1456 [Vannielia litorea]